MNNNPRIIFENDLFLVAYKPPYYIMTTSVNLTKKRISYMNKTKRKPFLAYVQKYILDNFNEYFTQAKSYGVCQRLDIETSGGVLISKYKKNWSICRNIVNNKKTTYKIYICLINGIITKKSGYIKKYTTCDTKPTYCNTFDNINENIKNKKKLRISVSYYQVYKEYTYKGNQYSLIIIRIFTGVTHQIRIHMKSLGTPIVSDDRYTDNRQRSDNRQNLISRMCLHNVYLEFTYLSNNIIQVPVPKDILECIRKLKEEKKYKINKLLSRVKYLENIL